MTKTFQKSGEITGSIYRAEAIVLSQTIASGQTGDLVTIGTAGKVTHLTNFTSSTGNVQSDISIEVDGIEIISGAVAASTLGGVFDYFVGQPLGSATPNMVAAAKEAREIYGEFITIKKGAGNTTENLLYSYSTGDTK